MDMGFYEGISLCLLLKSLYHPYIVSMSFGITSNSNMSTGAHLVVSAPASEGADPDTEGTGLRFSLLRSSCLS